jgi:hypothetical protein
LLLAAAGELGDRGQFLVLGPGLLPARRQDHAEQVVVRQRCQVLHRLAGQRAEHRAGRHRVRRLMPGEPRAQTLGHRGQLIQAHVPGLAEGNRHAGWRFPLRGDLDAACVDLGGQPVEVAGVVSSPVPRRVTGRRLIAVVPGAGERVLCHESPPSFGASMRS